jgi:Lrp/AsnC family leucine-responsive transcriptional regulator
MKALGKKEMEILAYLRSNGRHTVTQIGKKLGIPRTTVFDKIKKFKKLGLINRFTAIVDFNQLGHSVCAYIMFKCDPTRKLELGEALATSSHTNNVVKLGNDFDYMTSIVFENMNDMHAYLDILSSKYAVKETKILYIAKDLKREGYMAKLNGNETAQLQNNSGGITIERDDRFKDEKEEEL